MRTVLLLIASNTFMTMAWYGHLKHKAAPLLWVILASWLIALPEYAFHVPANRLGHGTYTAAQLKIMQEAISIGVFMVFCLFYLREPIRVNTVLAFALILAGAAVGMREAPGVAAKELPPATVPALPAP